MMKVLESKNIFALFDKPIPHWRITLWKQKRKIFWIENLRQWKIANTSYSVILSAISVDSKKPENVGKCILRNLQPFKKITNVGRKILKGTSKTFEKTSTLMTKMWSNLLKSWKILWWQKILQENSSHKSSLSFCVAFFPFAWLRLDFSVRTQRLEELWSDLCRRNQGFDAPKTQLCWISWLLEPSV